MNPQVIDTLITRIGLTPVQAVWVMSLSEKHAIWIANQIKSAPELFPKEGGKFKQIMKWKKNNTGLTLEGHTYDSVLKLINSDMPFTITGDSLKNQKVVAVCGDSEYKWVALKNNEDCIEEGNKMLHCLKHGGKSFLRGAKLYSLRDSHNRPVLTLQIKNRLITEYRAKSDRTPDERYAQYFKFLEEKEKLDVEIFSKFSYGLTKERQRISKLFKGDLVIPAGAGKSVKLPQGLYVTGDLVMEDYCVKLPKKLKVGGSLILNEYVHNAKITDVKVGKNLVLCSVYVKIDINNIKVGGQIVME